MMTKAINIRYQEIYIKFINFGLKALQNHPPPNSCDGSITYMKSVTPERIANWLRFWGCTAICPILPSTTNVEPKHFPSRHYNSIYSQARHLIYKELKLLQLQKISANSKIHLVHILLCYKPKNIPVLLQLSRVEKASACIWGVSTCTRKTIGCMWMVWFDNVVVDEQ